MNKSHNPKGSFNILNDMCHGNSILGFTGRSLGIPKPKLRRINKIPHDSFHGPKVNFLRICLEPCTHA
jgi:hypothetical protein